MHEVHRISFAVSLGYTTVIGQIDTAASSEIFISYRTWQKTSFLRLPVVEIAPASFEHQTEGFCTSCGSPRSPGASFCGACGAQFPQGEKGTSNELVSFRDGLLPLARSALLAQGADPGEGGELEKFGSAVLAFARASLQEHPLPQSTISETTEVLTLLEESLNAERWKPQVRNVVDGHRSNHENPLTLELVQRVDRKVDSSESLSQEEEQGLRLLLAEAPFTYGYWGPFKRVFKTLSPASHPVEFATAAHRLSSWQGRTNRQRKGVSCEDVGFLSVLGTVAGSRTKEYLRRNLLRKLVVLADEQPGTFVEFARVYLLAKDTSRNFADIVESFIVNGRGEFRDQWSRRGLVISADTAFTPPASQGWDAHPDYLTDLWSSVSNNAVILSFAFQALRARNAVLNDLAPAQLNLAVVSGYRPLEDYAVRQILERPDAWGAIRDKGWDRVLEGMSQDEVLDLLRQPELPWVALRQALELHNPLISDSAVSIFIRRSAEWEAASYALVPRLWELVIENSDSEQLTSLFHAVFLQVEPQKYLPSHARSAVEGLFQTLQDKWSSLATSATLSYLVLKVAGLAKFPNPTADVLARAIFVVSLHRVNLGPRWIAPWGETVGYQVMAKALVLMSQEGEAMGNVLPQGLGGLRDEAMDELASFVGERLRLEKHVTYWLSQMWSEFIREPKAVSGLRVLRTYPSRDHLSQALRSVRGNEEWELPEKGHLITLILIEAGRTFAELCEWRGENPDLWHHVDIEAVFNHSPELRHGVWQLLAGEASDLWLERKAKGFTALGQLVAELGPEDFATVSDAQSRILAAYLSRKAHRAVLPVESALACATAQDIELARWGVDALRIQKALNQVWLDLVESELPVALEAGFSALDSMRGKDELTDALLLALDSGVDVVRKRALAMIDTLGTRIQREQLFLRMSESGDPQVRNRVAEEALVSEWSAQPEIMAFDDRVLVTRRRARKAKEAVKTRLAGQDASGHHPTPERLKVLLDLAEHGRPRDAEWAQQRLVHLALAGAAINDVAISQVSEEVHDG